jgi:hypothetical protein
MWNEATVVDADCLMNANEATVVYADSLMNAGSRETLGRLSSLIVRER